MKAVCILVRNESGVLRDVSTVFAENHANIIMIHLEICEGQGNGAYGELYVEFEGEVIPDLLITGLRNLSDVKDVIIHRSFGDIFGKRVIIIGGGAQVAQVAMGAVNEADRHNIRGERISIDTIPLVGEETLALAIDAVPRLPRAAILVLAGSIMGGKAAIAVDRVKAAG
ncbi:MAG: DUF5612 domain-containing protein, partial [Methanobacteriota archaeon]